MTRLQRLGRLLPWAGALLVGALFPAALFSLLESNWRLFAAALAVSGLHALVFGSPALAVYRERDGRRLLPVLLGGFLIGALPIGSAMVLDGDLRSGGVLLSLGLEVMLVGGGFGALGGLACWLALYAFGGFR